MESQLSLNGSDMVKAARLFEQFSKSKVVTVEACHDDDEMFASGEFKEHLNTNNQELTLSGVSAHHQNAVAERVM